MITIIAILLVVYAFTTDDFWPAFACVALAGALLLAERALRLLGGEREEPLP